MSRRFLALLVAIGLAAPASAQGLTALVSTGPKDGLPTNTASSFHFLSTNPSVLALTQFNILGANPGSAGVTLLHSDTPLPLADISPANPLYLPLNSGMVLGGNLSPEVRQVYAGSGSGGFPATPFENVPLLSVTLQQAEGGKAGYLSYTASDADGAHLGGATLALPADGWWVLGFGSTGQLLPDPVPVDPVPVAVDPLAPTAGPSAPAETPEPTTLLLAGIGLAGAALVRKRRGRVN